MCMFMLGMEKGVGGLIKFYLWCWRLIHGAKHMYRGVGIVLCVSEGCCLCAGESDVPRKRVHRGQPGSMDSFPAQLPYYR